MHPSTHPPKKLNWPVSSEHANSSQLVMCLVDVSMPIVTSTTESLSQVIDMPRSLTNWIVSSI